MNLMKSIYLFPYRLKKWSGWTFVISIVFLLLLGLDYECFSKINPRAAVFAVVGNEEGVTIASDNSDVFSAKYFSIIYNTILDEILFFILIVSGLVYAFSKEEVEDEMTVKIRLDCLAWATYFNYAVFLILYLFFYGLPFLQVLPLALISNLLFFIIRFRWMVYKYKKQLHEE